MSFKTRRALLVLNGEDEEEIYRRRRRGRAYSVHPLKEVRHRYGEFHHLYGDLKNHPERFFKFLRMSVGTFDFILTNIQTKLLRKTTCKMPITPAERLYVTIR